MRLEKDLGFLPGDLKEKIDPYLRPIYDALNDMLSFSEVIKKIESGFIEIAPLAFMRGRTLSNAFIILGRITKHYIRSNENVFNKIRRKLKNDY